MKKKLLVIICMFLSILGFSQNIDIVTTSSSGNWSPQAVVKAGSVLTWTATLPGITLPIIINANDPEFDLDQSMLDIYEKKDYGRYANKRGQLPVNFLTDNDITGGNSGSPVINGKGELIGLAFDGNIEAMAGDVIFDSNLQRTINVDIRYVLWLIDKYSNAKHIVDELTIIDN